MPTKFDPTFAAIKTLSVAFCTPSNNPAYTRSDCAFANLFLAKKSCGLTLKNKSITKFVASMQSSSSKGPIFADPMSASFTSDRFTANAKAPCSFALSRLRFFASFTVPFSMSTTSKGVAPLLVALPLVFFPPPPSSSSFVVVSVGIVVVVVEGSPPSSSSANARALVLSRFVLILLSALKPILLFASPSSSARTTMRFPPRVKHLLPEVRDFAFIFELVLNV
mmetsp:Transcript_8370/g.27485  ORF Transcript_8370/g.27485 Transcript_8370/m.27485 type:complete len:223 (+) Transcript_8370:469-1137(+)